MTLAHLRSRAGRLAADDGVRGHRRRADRAGHRPPQESPGGGAGDLGRDSSPPPSLSTSPSATRPRTRHGCGRGRPRCTRVGFVVAGLRGLAAVAASRRRTDQVLAAALAAAAVLGGTPDWYAFLVGFLAWVTTLAGRTPGCRIPLRAPPVG